MMRLPKPGEVWVCNEGSATIVVVGAGLTFAGEGSVRQRVYFIWGADCDSGGIQRDSCSVETFLGKFKPVEPEADRKTVWTGACQTSDPYAESEPCAECERTNSYLKGAINSRDYWCINVIKKDNRIVELEAQVKELRAEKCDSEPCEECVELRAKVRDLDGAYKRLVTGERMLAERLRKIKTNIRIELAE